MGENRSKIGQKYMISCIFDLFYPHPPKPTFDLFLTYFNVFGVSGPLGGLLLDNIGVRSNPFTLRAKGTLISEPRFSTPCEMRFFPREKGKTAFVEGFFSTKAVFPFSRGKNRISQGVENRGSLISVPLALSVKEYWGEFVLVMDPPA